MYESISIVNISTSIPSTINHHNFLRLHKVYLQLSGPVVDSQIINSLLEILAFEYTQISPNYRNIYSYFTTGVLPSCFQLCHKSFYGTEDH